VTDGGTSNDKGWCVTIAHEVTRWADLADVDLLARLVEIRARDAEHLAGLTRAHHAMSGLGGGNVAVRRWSAWRQRWDRAAEYLEGHPVIRILAVFAVPLGVLATVVALTRG
jgi:hypothetical protein